MESRCGVRIGTDQHVRWLDCSARLIDRGLVIEEPARWPPTVLDELDGCSADDLRRAFCVESRLRRETPFQDWSARLYENASMQRFGRRLGSDFAAKEFSAFQRAVASISPENRFSRLVDVWSEHALVEVVGQGHPWDPPKRALVQLAQICAHGWHVSTTTAFSE